MKQGGGNFEVNTHTKFSTASHQLSMKVVSSAEKMPTVDLSTVSEIPSEAQIVKAISIIYKEKDKQPQNYIYMKFLFGNLCFNKIKRVKILL